MMNGRARYKSFTRALRRVRPWLIGLSVMMFIALWLVFQHKPGWYRPVEATEDVLRRVRREAPNLADTISDHLVRGEAIDMVLREATVNEWLAALPHIWPDARRHVPDDITQPAVSFEPGRVRVGAQVERSGWRAIGAIALELSLSEDGDMLLVRLSGVQGGSISVPRAMGGRWINRQLDRQRSAAVAQGESLRLSGEDSALAQPGRGYSTGRTERATNGLGDVWRRVESADELFSGVIVPNRFVWPNGRREFRLGSLTVLNGEVRIRLEPLQE